MRKILTDAYLISYNEWLYIEIPFMKNVLSILLIAIYFLASIPTSMGQVICYGADGHVELENRYHEQCCHELDENENALTLEHAELSGFVNQIRLGGYDGSDACIDVPICLVNGESGRGRLGFARLGMVLHHVSYIDLSIDEPRGRVVREQYLDRFDPWLWQDLSALRTVVLLT